MKDLTFCGGCLWKFHKKGFDLKSKEVKGSMNKEMFCYGCNTLVQSNKFGWVSKEEFQKGKARAVKAKLRQE